MFRKGKTEANRTNEIKNCSCFTCFVIILISLHHRTEQFELRCYCIAVRVCEPLGVPHLNILSLICCTKICRSKKQKHRIGSYANQVGNIFLFCIKFRLQKPNANEFCIKITVDLFSSSDRLLSPIQKANRNTRTHIHIHSHRLHIFTVLQCRSTLHTCPLYIRMHDKYTLTFV